MVKTVAETLEDPAIRWTKDVDPIDENMFNTAVTNMWLARNHAVGADRGDWNTKVAPKKKLCLSRNFAGLTGLDTLQSLVGVPTLCDYALTPHESQALKIIEAQECTHVQAYSHIFIELDGATLADKYFDWVDNHSTFAEKKKLIHDAYMTGDGSKVRAASIVLENGFFYTGFFYILHLNTHENILPETTAIIRAIIRDEALHGYYIGYKYQQSLEGKTPEEKEKYKEYVIDLFLRAYDIECRYTEDLYGDVGLVDEVQKFICYNFNKGMQNMGYDDLFPEEMCCADAAVCSALDAPDIQDFFSLTSSSYRLIDIEEMSDREWAGF